MKIGRKTLAAAVVLGATFVASPAFAWTCTAKNVRGATYSAIGPIRANVIDRALAKCRANTLYAGTCVIISCY